MKSAMLPEEILSAIVAQMVILLKRESAALGDAAAMERYRIRAQAIFGWSEEPSLRRREGRLATFDQSTPN